MSTIRQVIGRSLFWKCPNCGALLRKSAEKQPFAFLGLQPRRVLELVTCQGCKGSVARSLVYGGAFDVPEIEAICQSCHASLRGPADRLSGKPCPQCQAILPATTMRDHGPPNADPKLARHVLVLYTSSRTVAETSGELNALQYASCLLATLDCEHSDLFTDSRGAIYPSRRLNELVLPSMVWRQPNGDVFITRKLSNASRETPNAEHDATERVRTAELLGTVDQRSFMIVAAKKHGLDPMHLVSWFG